MKTRRKRDMRKQRRAATAATAAARRRARNWVAATAMAPALLLPAALLGASTPAPHPAQDNLALRELGVSGNLPKASQLSPRLLHDVGDPRALTAPPAPAAPGGPSAPPLDLPRGDLGIPAPALAAYVGATREVAVRNPDCHLDWSVLASIGRIESGHARNGDVDVDGNTAHAILGPRLSGGPEIAAIPDSDGGRFDGDPVWDRAVGPMQFIPATWNKYAVDANHDGVASPHNLYDATAAAGDYLCTGRSGLNDPINLAQSVFSYNHSEDYVRTVLIWADAYRRGVTPTPTEVAPEVEDVLAGARLPKDAPTPDLPPLHVPTPQELGMLPPKPPAEDRPEPLVAPGPVAEPGPVVVPTPNPVPPPPADKPAEPAPPEVSIRPLAPVNVPPPSEQPVEKPAPQQPAPQPAPQQPAAPQAPVESSIPAPSVPDLPPVVPAIPSEKPARAATPPPTTETKTSTSETKTSTSEPTSEPNSAPTQCDPRIVQSGEFTQSSPGPGVDIKPGTTNPSSVVPGQPVYTDQGVCIVGKA